MLTLPACKADFIRIRQRIALIEAILSPEWEYRYFSYNAHWTANSQMASMRDGSGNEWFALIDDYGMAIIARVDAPADPACKNGLPAYWHGDNFLHEAAFANVVRDGNFCAWKANSDAQWTMQYAPANEALLAACFIAADGNAAAYCDFAADYYERDIGSAAVRHILDAADLSEEDLRRLDPDLDLNNLQEDLQEIGIRLT